MPSIRGHMGKIKFFMNGQNTGIVNITSVDINQDSTFSRSFYVGKQLGEGDQVIEGWSGSVDCEVKDSSIDDMIDSLISGNLAGVGADEFTFMSEEYYPNGTIVSYVYFDVQFRMSKRHAGMNEKVTKRLDFQAAGRAKL